MSKRKSFWLTFYKKVVRRLRPTLKVGNQRDVGSNNNNSLYIKPVRQLRPTLKVGNLL